MVLVVRNFVIVPQMCCSCFRRLECLCWPAWDCGSLALRSAVGRSNLAVNGVSKLKVVWPLGRMKCCCMPLIGRCWYPPSIHQLSHLLQNTLFTLHTCGLSHQQQPHHIKPSIICLGGLLHPYHVKVLHRKAPLVRRNLCINGLASIWQGIQTASHRTPVSIIQAPKQIMANIFHYSPASTNPVTHLSKVLSCSWDT